jgi:hypothetical protein
VRGLSPVPHTSYKEIQGLQANFYNYSINFV